MKKIILILASAMVVLISCKKNFLDRQPLSQLSPSTSFSSSNDLQLYVNSFYSAVFPPEASIYSSPSDNVAHPAPSSLIDGNRTVPLTGGGWDWGALRNINFFLQNYGIGHLAPSVTAPYVGIARFFRAYFYFNMLMQFGDLPWYSDPISPDDTAMLHKPRDSRTLIVDSILADLNYAIANCPTAPSVDQITKWTALALKSRVCLYEGTWREYHANDVFGKDINGNPLTGWQDLLQQCVAASDSLMKSGEYSVYTSTPDKAYAELFNSPTPVTSSIILAETFNADLQVYQDVNYYTLAPSYGRPGLTGDLVNTYLMKDGSRFTDIPGHDTMQFYEEVQNRDPRLAQTIRTPGYTRIGGTQELPPDLGTTVTGFQPTKFVGPPSQDQSNRSLNPLPLFRYGEVLLNYAEAKAELGILTQTDLDKSVNLLLDRVGMPHLNMAYANANPDPYLEGEYPNVTGSNKGVILEIRRQRRIELVMEGFRWNDLMRWADGPDVAKEFYGAYFPGPGSYDLDGNGTVDVVIYTGTEPPVQQGVVYLKLGSDVSLRNGVNGGDIVIAPNTPKVFHVNRDYLNPIPAQELLLNPNLKQNPGW